jgi:hypothetical protein
MMKEKLESKRIWIFMTVAFGIETIATTFLVKGQPNPLFGPAVVSLLTFLPFTVLAFWLRRHPDVFSHANRTLSQPETVPARSQT